jgi:hypothetical protein
MDYRMAKNKDTNAAYRQRASKRQRTHGPRLEEGQAVVDQLLIDRQRRGRKQYRWTDLTGHDRIEMLRMVRDCAMAAMTTHEIATYFGVSVNTLHEWIAKDPEFAIAMRLPRELADERVEKALFHRAVGYSFAAEEVKIHDDGRITRTPVIKHVPPDVTAATFWLKNRKGHLWKEKQDVAIEGNIDITQKSDDPRALAMAVLDVIQQGIYAKLPETIEHEPVTRSVDLKPLSEYTADELEALTPEQLDALYDSAGREDD